MSESEREPGRWTCPGRHCGTYQGYKYGCRDELCTAAVAPYSAARRAAAGHGERVAIDSTVRRRILDAVRGGASLVESCKAAGITWFRLGGIRRADPDFDAALVSAGREGGLTPPLRPVRRIRCPGSDCGTLEGYRQGCRNDSCRDIHSASLQRAPSRRKRSSARRFGADDRAAVLAHLRDGRTIMDAVRLAGWSYDALSTARKLDPAFDTAVIAARRAARRAGEPGDYPREVNRVDGAAQ